jgi:hypothetical protein
MERQSTPRHPHSRIYLVRLWRDDATAAWRVSVQGPTDPVPRGFADLDSFMDYLRHLTASPPPADTNITPARAPPAIHSRWETMPQTRPPCQMYW